MFCFREIHIFSNFLSATLRAKLRSAKEITRAGIFFQQKAIFSLIYF